MGFFSKIFGSKKEEQPQAINRDWQRTPTVRFDETAKRWRSIGNNRFVGKDQVRNRWYVNHKLVGDTHAQTN